MANPKVYEHDYSDWYWDERRIELELKTPATVIKAKTIVHKSNNGKIEPWNPQNGNGKGVLYIVSKTTIEQDKTVVCICHGKVKQSEIIFPDNVSWTTEKDGATVFDNVVLRSQIELI